MSDRYEVKLTPRAEWDLDEAERWWSANRTKAPNALKEEMRGALATLSSTPGIGSVAGNVSLPGVRRILLNRVKYFLYYRVDAEQRVVEVVALWHARRGTPPDL